MASCYFQIAAHKEEMKSCILLISLLKALVSVIRAEAKSIVVASAPKPSL
jgi:hypothetical protein